MTTEFFYIELPDDQRFGLVAFELPGGRWARPRTATDDDWLQGAHLSSRRLRRCRKWSATWWRHRAIIAEAERRCGRRADAGSAVCRVARMSRTDAVLVDRDGRITDYYGPQLTEGLPPVALEGLARRRLVALGSTCPCGARMVLPSRAERRAARRRSPVLSVQIEHEDDCPAVCPELLDGRWRR